jgi:N-acetylglutamate synthase/N-acetylornithine aminotransferase
MKLSINKSGVTLAGLTMEQFKAVMTVVETANDRCFNEINKDGDYYSNDDFVCTLSGKERVALDEFCRSFNRQTDKLYNDLN